MSDTISRDAAIRALVQAHEETGVKTAQAIRIIRELPAADARDLIDRDKLIDFIMESDPEWCIKPIRPIFDYIKEMPSTQPERKKGKWIDNNGLYQCSACKHIWSELWWVESCPMDRMNKLMRYCPSCGAKMNEKETEDE